MDFLEGLNSLQTSFLIIFLVGLLLTILTWVFGEIFEVGTEIAHDIGGFVSDIAGDIGTDVGVGAGGVDLAGDFYTPSPFSSRVMFTALTAFGGFGFIGSYYEWPVAATMLFALGGFFTISVVVFLGVVLPLARQQGSTREVRSDYLNKEAQVASEIPEQGSGLVVLVSPASGSRVTQAASSATGQKIPQGTTVKIVRVTPGGVVVTPLAEN